MKFALLALLLGVSAWAQNCTLTAFPVQVVNGQIVCPTPPPPPPAPSTVTWADPSTVLVVMEANTGPEPGTGTTNASQWVANHYLQARGIPTANLLTVSTGIIVVGGGAVCQPGGNCDVAHGDSTNRPIAECMSNVMQPIAAALAANPKLKYIAPIYGVPVTCYNSSSGYPPVSLDSMLASVLVTPGAGILTPNPYFNGNPASNPAHIDTSTAKVMLVSRLDGPTAVLAAALVDKALAGEAGIHGIGYFDWQGLGTSASQQTYPFQQDYSMFNAYTFCTQLPNSTCALNNQQTTHALIKSAPNAAWAWGWYDSSAANASAYAFVPGAVGAQLTSYTASTIRRPSYGAYVYYWLNQGITATWGAVNEPYATYYALGDSLLSHLWRGYTFGEAAYISSPVLNWMMVFVGDPLYRPRLL